MSLSMTLPGIETDPAAGNNETIARESFDELAELFRQVGSALASRHFVEPVQENDAPAIGEAGLEPFPGFLRQPVLETHGDAIEWVRAIPAP